MKLKIINADRDQTQTNRKKEEEEGVREFVSKLPMICVLILSQLQQSIVKIWNPWDNGIIHRIIATHSNNLNDITGTMQKNRQSKTMYFSRLKMKRLRDNCEKMRRKKSTKNSRLCCSLRFPLKRGYTLAYAFK